MTETGSRDECFERIAQYFRRSRFDYLALEIDGRALRLTRDAREMAAVARVIAASVGFIAPRSGSRRLPAVGDRVERGDILFTIRRFKTAVDVTAPASGILASISVEDGAFVEYAQPLATIG